MSKTVFSKVYADILNNPKIIREKVNDISSSGHWMVCVGCGSVFTVEEGELWKDRNGKIRLTCPVCDKRLYVPHVLYKNIQTTRF